MNQSRRWSSPGVDANTAKAAGGGNATHVSSADTGDGPEDGGGGGGRQHHASVIVSHHDLQQQQQAQPYQQPLGDLFQQFLDPSQHVHLPHLLQYPQQWYTPTGGGWPAAISAAAGGGAEAAAFYQPPYENAAASGLYANTPSSVDSRPSSSIADILSPIYPPSSAVHQHHHQPPSHQHYSHYQHYSADHQHSHHQATQQQTLFPTLAGMPSHQMHQLGTGGYGAAAAPYRVVSMQKRRSSGGRRPREEDGDRHLSVEELDKKLKRRQRNKEAAARCRQRRLDQMNELAVEVEGLKDINRAKDQEIRRLFELKNKLEYILRNHGCKQPSLAISIEDDSAAGALSDSEHEFSAAPAKRNVLGVHVATQPKHHNAHQQQHNTGGNYPVSATAIVVKTEPHQQMELTLGQAAITCQSNVRDSDLQRPTSLFCGSGTARGIRGGTSSSVASVGGAHPQQSSATSLMLSTNSGGNNANNNSNAVGVSITTPSNGLTPGFSQFELLGQSTGLTPIANIGLTPLFPITSNALETPMDTKRSLESL